MSSGNGNDFVSRAGEKLNSALDQFPLDPAGWVCADFGSHVGGFVDCLLSRGARKVYSVDTSYGTLAWKLRKDDRVVVIERQNAMHVELPEPMDLITIDVGWTPQQRILPNAARCLKPGGRVVTLIKPHYEAPKEKLVDGVLPDANIPEVLDRVSEWMTSNAWSVVRKVESPIRGHGGNREFLALLTRAT